MALYTFKTREEATAPLKNYAGDSKWVNDQLKTMGYNNFGVSTFDDTGAAKSRSQLAKDNFNALSGKDDFFAGYTSAAQKAYDNGGYKNLFNESAFGTANNAFTKALDKIGYDNINTADEWLAKYNSLSSDDKWDVYQNIQKAKDKLTQAYTKADNEKNDTLKDAYGSGLQYVSLFEDLISDVDKGDKSFGKSLGDWLTSGGIAGDMSKPMVNALGDITGSAETSKYVTTQYDKQNEGNNGVVSAVNNVGTAIGNIGANVVTGGAYGLGTSAANLAHEGISAINDSDRAYYVDQNGNVVRQNQTNEQKAADIGGAALNLGLNILGKAGVGPTLKFGNNASLQELAKSGNIKELLKGAGKYAAKEVPWALATSAADTAIQAAGYGDEAWNKFGENLGKNIVSDAAMDVTGAVRQGVRGNTADNTVSKMPEAQETEVYRAISGDNGETTDARDITSVFEPDANLNIQKRNKLQSIGDQLQNAAKTQKYSALYDALDAKTASRAVQTGAPEALAKLGVTPENYKEAAKTSNYVNKVVSDLAEQSGVKVNVPDLPQRLSADDMDILMSDTARKKYDSYVKQIVADGSSPDEYSAGYLLQKSRELGSKAANLRGNTDDVRALRQALTEAKYKLRDIATSSLEGAEITGDLTNDNIANGLAKIGANQKIQDYYTEAVDGKAPSVSDYIRRSALFEQARDMGEQMEAEKFTRSASKAPTNPMTKIWNASGLDKPLETVLKNTVSPLASGVTKFAGKLASGAGDLYAKVGDTTKNFSPENLANTAKTAGSDFVKNLTNFEASGTNPQMFMYSAVNNNDVKENAMEKERVANYLTAVANDTNAAGPMTSETAVYNTIAGNTGATNGTTNGSTATQNSIFPRTGDYWTDLIAGAMELAMEADDAAAFNNLYSMYQDALKNSTSTSAKTVADLSATQQAQLAKLESADAAINELEDLFNKAGGGKGPIAGNLQSIAGTWGWDSNANTYNQLAEGLVNQIAQAVGKTDSLNTEGEVKRALQLIPQLTDDATTAKNKLEELRRMLANTKASYNTAYGLTS